MASKRNNNARSRPVPRLHSLRRHEKWHAKHKEEKGDKMFTFQSRWYRGQSAIFIALSMFALTLMLAMNATQAAPSTTITVNSTADVLADDGECTLREAITAANSDTASGLSSGECAAGSGDDTIMLSAETYRLTLAGADEDNNMTGDLDITSNLTIEVTSDLATIDGNQLDRVLDVHSNATVTIKKVVMTGGKTPDGSNGAPGEHGTPGAPGAGILNSGVLTLIDCTVSNSRTGVGGDGGHGSSSSGGNGGHGGNGGAIFNRGQLMLITSIIHDNSTGKGGEGGNAGSSGNGGNGGQGGHGGAIYNDSSGELTVIASIIHDNTTSGTIRRRIGDGGDGGEGGHGGGIYNAGSLIINSSAIRDNSTSPGGTGGPGNNDNGGNGGNGGHGGAVYHVSSDPLTLTNTTINNNTTGNGGNGGTSQSGAQGGDGGLGGFGGGIYHAGFGVLTLQNSTISGNRTGNGGNGGNGGHATRRGDSSRSPDFSASGGSKTTEVGRAPGLSPTGGNGGYAGNGGGIYNVGDGALIISNSTVSGNRTGNGGNANGKEGFDGNGGDGGGIFSDNMLTITHSTITDNMTGLGGDNGTPGHGGGIFGGMTLKNTIVAGNKSSGTALDCAATVTSLGYNLLQESSNCTIIGDRTGNITGQDPVLAPLANNGGSTHTHALRLGSPALDAGHCSDISTDQRGQARPVDLPTLDNQDDGCDIGAYEVQREGFLLTKTVDNSTPSAGQGIIYTISIMGLSNSNSAVISDTLPTGLIFAGPVTFDPPQADANLAQSADQLPTLASSVTITDGQRITLTFPVTIESKLAVGTTITNVASVYSKEHPTQRRAEVSITVASVLNQRLYLPLLVTSASSSR